MEEKLAMNIVALCLSCLVLASVGEITAGSIMPGRDVNMTVQTGDCDVYDCVDLYKQPAFNHPLLKNHKIQQMEPSSYPLDLDVQSMLTSNDSESNLPNIHCPTGTTPILRNDNKGSMPLLLDNGSTEEEYAAIKYWDENFYGTRATLNVFQPFLVRKNGDYIASWAQVSNSPEEIGAGSIVWPSFSGDNFARFHIHWVGSTKKRCYDFNCPGFVQVSRSAAVGGRVWPLSVYNGPQYVITVVLFQDQKTKDWWLARRDKKSPIGYRPLGYWPGSLFNSLSQKATSAFWGGFVRGPTVSSDPPVMGSGHFASEGYRKAAFVKEIQISNPNNEFVNPNTGRASPRSSRPNCYTVDGFGVNDWGIHAYYGGPGQCAR
ncbi:hypothetical protein ABZP36_031887 [Zizania latifolia]